MNTLTLLPMLVPVLISVAVLIVAIKDAAHRPSRGYTLSKRTSITLLVMIDADVSTTVRCLKSIQYAAHQPVDVVLIYDARLALAKSGEYRRVLRQFTKLDHYFYQMRKSQVEAEALRQAYKRSQKGDIVVTISTRMVLADGLLADIPARVGDVTNFPIDLAVTVPTQAGFISISLSLRAAIARLIKALRWTRIRQSADLRVGSVFSSMQCKSRSQKMYTTNRSNRSLRVSRSLQPTSARALVQSLPMFDVALCISALVILAALAMNAVYGDGIELFTYTWLSISTSLLLITLFDAELAPRQKRDITICVAFLPVLAPFVRIVSRSVQ